MTTNNNQISGYAQIEGIAIPEFRKYATGSYPIEVIDVIVAEQVMSGAPFQKYTPPEYSGVMNTTLSGSKFSGLTMSVNVKGALSSVSHYDTITSTARLNGFSLIYSKYNAYKITTNLTTTSLSQIGVSGDIVSAPGSASTQIPIYEFGRTNVSTTATISDSKAGDSYNKADLLDTVRINTITLKSHAEIKTFTPKHTEQSDLNCSYSKNEITAMDSIDFKFNENASLDFSVSNSLDCIDV